MTQTNLPTATLGRTGLEVTRLGYGAMEVRGSRIWGGRPVTEEQAKTILNAVLDAGINFIDTANDYGRSEEFIGKYIANRRDEYYLATKCGCTVVYKDETTDDTPHVWTRENLFRGLEESLTRMKTDYVDIMQLHNPSVEQAEAGELVEALKDMRKQGKTRFIGISTTLPHLPTYIDWGVFDTFQIPYSALERDHEEWITRARQSDIGTIIRGGVARGEPGEGLGNTGSLGEVRGSRAGRAAGAGRIAHGVHAALHPQPPLRGYDHRGHALPRTPRGERRRGAGRAALARCVQAGEETAG